MIDNGSSASTRGPHVRHHWPGLHVAEYGPRHPSPLKSAKQLNLAIALAFGVSGATAADWMLIRGPEQGAPGYLQVDRATVSREGSTVSFWQRAVYPRPLEIPGAPGLKTRVVVSHMILDCAKRVETIGKVVYLSDDQSQFKLAERGPFGPDDIIPGTPAEEVLEFMCSGKPIPAAPKPGGTGAPRSATPS